MTIHGCGGNYQARLAKTCIMGCYWYQCVDRTYFHLVVGGTSLSMNFSEFPNVNSHNLFRADLIQIPYYSNSHVWFQRFYIWEIMDMMKALVHLRHRGGSRKGL
jgi:hypothetical protein